LLEENCNIKNKILDDKEKKKIHLKLKNISFGMLFISEKTNCTEIEQKYISIKDLVISEEFSTRDFCVTSVYLKGINNRSNEIKKYIKDIVCKHIESL